MTRRARPTPRRTLRANARAAFLFASLCCFIAMPGRAFAASLEDYRARVQFATDILIGLERSAGETDDMSAEASGQLEERAVQGARAALPAREKIEGAGFAYDVDNRWLHEELDLYANIAKDKTDERGELLLRVTERLRALDARLAEAANTVEVARDKEAEKGRLNAILQRREYNEQAAEDTALGRVWKNFKEWLRRLMPESRPIGEGAANTFSVVARLFVFALTAAVIIYVLWKYGALLLPRNRPGKKKTGSEARVVLGERLAPGQTPADLIEQAEALARAGDLRGAIRKAYIAVLFELGERRVLRLAAHKTNRDYLSAIRRERAALYDDMQPLTHNYERHWYGFAPATAADWHDFRTRCRQLTQ
jgi:hypothetical protein